MTDMQVVSFEYFKRSIYTYVVKMDIWLSHTIKQATSVSLTLCFYLFLIIFFAAVETQQIYYLISKESLGGSKYFTWSWILDKFVKLKPITWTNSFYISSEGLLN